MFPRIPSHTVRYFCIAFFAFASFSLAVGYAVPFWSPERAYRVLDTDRLDVNAVALIIVAAIVALGYLSLRFARFVKWVVVLALVLRIIAAVIIGETTPLVGGDTWAYTQIAQNISANRGIVLTGGITPTYAMYPPLYSILLSFAIEAGASAAGATFIVNLACDLWAALMLKRIAEELSPRRSAWTIAAIYLLIPPALTGAIFASKEPLAIALLLSIVLAFLRCRDTFTFRDAVWLGISIALLAMTQPAWLGVIAGFGVLFLYWAGPRQTVRLAAYSLPVFAIVLAPWIIRNYARFDAFVPLTTSMGANMYFVVTNSYDAAKAIMAEGRNELEGSRLGWALAMREIAAEPLLYLRNQIASFGLSWTIRGWHGATLALDGGDKFWASVFARVTALIDLALMLGMAWIARIRRIDRDTALIMFAGLASLLTFNFWFELGERHLMFLSPFYLLFIARHYHDPRLEVGSEREEQRE